MKKLALLLLCSSIVLASVPVQMASAASTTLVNDEFTSKTAPEGAAYSDLSLDYKSWSDHLNWTTPKPCPDDTALNLKKGAAGAGTATYTLNGTASEVEIGFYCSASNFISRYTFGYLLGWEWLNITDTGKDRYGKDRAAGTYSPVDVSKIFYAYIDKDDRVYAKTPDAGWTKYISDPSYVFSPITTTPTDLVNLGVYLQYSNDGQNWTYVDYTITSVRSMDDSKDSVVPESNHWNYETAKATLPTPAKYVRVNLYMPFKYYGTDATGAEKIIDDTNDRNWRIAIGKVVITGTGTPAGNTQSAAASTPGTSKTSGKSSGAAAAVASSNATVSEDATQSSSVVSDDTVSSEIGSSDSSESVPGSTGPKSGLPVGWIILIVCVVLAGAGAAVYFLVIRKKIAVK